MSANTPNTPTKAPNIPTGPKSKKKTSNSKVMKPMAKASGTNMGHMPPAGSKSVSPTSQGQTVQGGPRK